jgi:tetratricopeptide (TPR) repeat protein
MSLTSSVVAISILALGLTTPAASAATPTLHEAIDRLEAVADAYPPRVTPETRKEIEDLWRGAEKGMLQYCATHPAPDANAEFMLGEIYRLGHNLDIDDASDKAIAHFKAAIKLDPTSSKFHLMLGRHFTYINELDEGQRELLLAVALDPKGAGDRPLFDLTHNYYLQHQFALAANFGDRYLAIHPDEAVIKLIVETSKKILAGAPVPKMLSIEVP